MMQRKIYYVPGLISLVALPIMVTFYLNCGERLDKQRVLQVHWQGPVNNDETSVDQSVFIQRSEKTRFTEITLDSDYQRNKFKLRFAAALLNELITSRDSVYGIHIAIADHAPYEVFVRAIELCETTAVSYYGSGNDIWIFATPFLLHGAAPVREFRCGTYYSFKNIDDRALMVKVSDVLKSQAGYWPVWTLFVMLIVLAWKKEKTTASPVF